MLSAEVIYHFAQFNQTQLPGLPPQQNYFSIQSKAASETVSDEYFYTLNCFPIT